MTRGSVLFRRPSLGVLALVAASLLLGLLTPLQARAATSYTLTMSTSPTRSSPVGLNGQTVKGGIYVWTTPETSVRKSEFFVDDPSMAKTPFHTESTAPFDINGGAPDSPTAFNTTTLADGSHTVTQRVTDSSGVVQTYTATFTVKNATTSTTSYTLTMSTSPTRSSPVALNGQTVKGGIYVWTTPETSVRKSEFFVDDPSMAKTPFHSESTAPFDLNGGSPDSPTAFNTATLADGSHTITQRVTTTAGTITTYTATFTVKNATTTTPAPAPTTASAISPSPVVLSGAVNTPGVVESVTITNTTTRSLTLTKIALTGTDAVQFALSGTPALPLTLAAGATTKVGVRLSGTSTGVKGASLVVTTSDATTPTLTAPVRGLVLSSAGAEPSLQRVFDTWQIPVSTGGTSDTIYLPSTTPLGDEVNGQVFVKAGSGSVSVTPLASYTGSAVDPTLTYGWVPEGTLAPASTLFSVPGSENRTLQVHPSGATSFDPGTTPFGLTATFGGSGRQTYQERRLNTFSGALPTQARVYPYRTSAGATVANAYIVAFEDAVSGSNLEYNDAVVLVRNVTLEQLIASPVDAAPANDRLVMSRIGTNLNTSTTNVTHDRASLRLTNTGSVSRRVTSATVSGPFTLVAPTTLPATIAAGSSLDITVRFVATSGSAVQTGTLTIGTDDPATPTRTVSLGATWQAASGGDNEVSLQSVVSAFGYKTTLTKSGENINTRGSAVAVGDEVLSAFWQRADSTLPVTAIQLASFQGAAASGLFYYPSNTRPDCSVSGCTRVVLNQSTNYQTLLPATNGGTTVASGTWSPTTPFGLNVNRVEYTDDSRNSTTGDINWNCPGSCGHHVRMFPVKNAAGAVVPNTYLLAEDSNGINFDYQDNVYLIRNIKPAA